MFSPWIPPNFPGAFSVWKRPGMTRATHDLATCVFAFGWVWAGGVAEVCLVRRTLPTTPFHKDFHNPCFNSLNL